MSETKKHDFNGFTITLFQDEDGDWLAYFVEMPNISAFADTPYGAIDELQIAWEGIKESYRKHGEEIPIAPSRQDQLLYTS
jgi:predicted RNase H-like HicB family nuclease